MESEKEVETSAVSYNESQVEPISSQDLGQEVQEENLASVEITPGGAPEVVPTPAAELDPEQRKRIVFALLFASPDPLSPTRLAESAGLSLSETRETIESIRSWIQEQKLPFHVEELGAGLQLLSLKEFEPYIRRLAKVRRQDKLSQAALETLAIVAYRQPIIKAEMEAIRGVQVGPILRTLIEKRLIKVDGRAKVPGSPLQYATTQHFLDRFGLKSIQELPTLQELRQS